MELSNRQCDESAAKPPEKAIDCLLSSPTNEGEKSVKIVSRFPSAGAQQHVLHGQPVGARPQRGTRDTMSWVRGPGRDLLGGETSPALLQRSGARPDAGRYGAFGLCVRPRNRVPQSPILMAAVGLTQITWTVVPDATLYWP